MAADGTPLHRKTLADDSRPMSRQVLALAAPALAQQSCLFLIQQTDQYLARAFSPEHQAALTTANYLYWFVSSYSVVVSTGATALVGRFFGAQHLALANRTAAQAIILAMFLGVMGTVAALLGLPTLMEAVRLPGASPTLAVAYLTPLAVVLALQMTETAGIACFVGAGDTRTGLYVLCGVATVNVPVAYALSRGAWGLPHLGFAGIAYGTAAAHTTGSCIILWLLFRGRSGLKLTWPNLKPDFSLLRRLLKVSLPAAADSLSVAVCQLWFLSVVNTLGTTAAAAHGIALRWEALGYLSGAAFGTAAAALVSQNLGAKQYNQAARGGARAFQLGGTIMTFMGVIFYAFAPAMCELYSPGNPDVARQGVSALRTIAFVMPFLASVIVFTSALRAAGDTRFPVLFTWIGFLGVRLPLAYWLTAEPIAWGIFGIWFAMSADLVVRGLLLGWRFARGRWKKIEV